MRKIHLFADRLQESLMEEAVASGQAFIRSHFPRCPTHEYTYDDLLTYSHVSRKAVAEESVDLNKKVGAVLEDLELEIEEKNATVVAGALPTIKGHRRQLQQLFKI
jgi:light-regulated signal transduction histidine kinase (bacteriophytochrome)